MVNDMLDIEKLNSGKMNFTYKDFDIYSILTHMKEELQYMCDEKKISLHVK